MSLLIPIIFCAMLHASLGAVCPSGYLDVGSGCYSLIQAYTTADNDRVTCDSMNGSLVVVKSKGYNSYLWGVLNQLPNYEWDPVWLGLTVYANGTATWADGTQYVVGDFTSFSPPNEETYYMKTQAATTPGGSYCLAWNGGDWISASCGEGAGVSFQGLCRHPKATDMVYPYCPNAFYGLNGRCFMALAPTLTQPNHIAKCADRSGSQLYRFNDDPAFMAQLFTLLSQNTTKTFWVDAKLAWQYPDLVNLPGSPPTGSTGNCLYYNPAASAFQLGSCTDKRSAICELI